jgi:nucleoside-diphosphate-sugar epimerase
MKKKKDKVLIIGGSGFIGHNLAITLQKEFNVSVIDSFYVNNVKSFKNKISNNQNRFYIKILKERIRLLRENKIKIYNQDARNYKKISTLVDKINPNYIFHLAAVAHANVSNKNPFSTFDNSVRTLENALDATRSLKKLKRFFYLSSSMLYGQFKKSTVNEDTICEPLGIYGALKFAGEKMVIGYNQVFKTPYTIIRPSALYGERCVSRRVIQIFIESALKDEPVLVNGDGKEKLDFTYIGDLINGMVKMIKNNKSKNEIFNLTYGKSRSILELINILKSYFPKLKIKTIKRDKLMPIRGTLSMNKAKKLLKFKSEYNLEKGIEKMINWYKKKDNEKYFISKN